MATTTRTVTQVCESAQAASRRLARASSATKDATLRRIAELLRERSDAILAANQADLEDERAASLTSALRDQIGRAHV